jgi:hypothetical protein
VNAQACVYVELDWKLEAVCKFKLSLISSLLTFHNNFKTTIVCKMTHLFWAQLMGATLKVATYQRKGHNVTILSRKLQTHVELIFKYLVVKTDMKTDRNLIQCIQRSCKKCQYERDASIELKTS